MSERLENKYGPFGSVGITCDHGYDFCRVCDGPWLEREASARGFAVEVFTATCLAFKDDFKALQHWLDATRPGASPEPAGDNIQGPR